MSLWVPLLKWKESRGLIVSNTLTHTPVLLEEVVEALSSLGRPAARYFDGTFGRGGHTSKILSTFPQSICIACDGDRQAIDYGYEAFAGEVESNRLTFVHGSYSEFEELRRSHPSFVDFFDGILLDLGVSSPQLEEAERGFSFYHDGPLDMRMNQDQELRASDIINEWSADDLVQLFQELGEVLRPYRLVRALVNDRKEKPFESTQQLSSLIERIDGWRRKGSHPATRYFLALRMAVNDELGALRRSLPHLIDGLREGGRLVIISFHSLEDRVVKQTFRREEVRGKRVNKKVITATKQETQSNPRSRSAKLRIFEKGVEYE